MTTITIASTKGGAGKTTVSTGLAYLLAQMFDTTLIDFDPQGQCTLFFGLPVHGGVYQWLIGGEPLPHCLLQGRPERLRILGGDSRSWAIQADIHRPDAYDAFLTKLQRACWALPRMDREGQEIFGGFVVIDTAPGGQLQQAAIEVADLVIIPFRPEHSGLDGVDQTLEIIKQRNPDASVTALPVGYDTRVNEHWINVCRVLDTVGPSMMMGDEDDIRGKRRAETFSLLHRIAVAESVAWGQPVPEFANKKLDPVRVGLSLLLNRVLALTALRKANAEIEQGGQP